MSFTHIHMNTHPHFFIYFISAKIKKSHPLRWPRHVGALPTWSCRTHNGHRHHRIPGHVSASGHAWTTDAGGKWRWNYKRHFVQPTACLCACKRSFPNDSRPTPGLSKLYKKFKRNHIFRFWFRFLCPRNCHRFHIFTRTSWNTSFPVCDTLSATRRFVSHSSYFVLLTFGVSLSYTLYLETFIVNSKLTLFSCTSDPHLISCLFKHTWSLFLYLSISLSLSLSGLTLLFFLYFLSKMLPFYSHTYIRHTHVYYHLT